MPTDDDHPRWNECGDQHCDRFPCVVYKEGYADGFEDGHGAGYGAGYADGYGEGFDAGAASVSE